MRRGPFVGALAVAALGLTACGGAASTSPHAAKVNSSSTTATSAPPSTTTSPTVAPTTSATAQPPATTTTTISVAAAGQQFLAAVSPLNSAISQFYSAIQSDNTTTSPTALKQQASPLISAFHTAESALAQDTWPSSAQADMKTFITDLAVVVSDYSSIAGSTDGHTLQRDITTSLAADQIVRHDLGLPPAQN